MTTDDLRALIETAGRATPGPWQQSAGADENGNWCALGPEHSTQDTESEDEADLLETRAYHDAAHIAACSPERIAALARVALAAAPRSAPGGEFCILCDKVMFPGEGHEPGCPWAALEAVP